MRAPLCSAPSNYSSTILTSYVYHTFCLSYYVSTVVHHGIEKKQCHHWHPWSRTNYSSATPSPPHPLTPPFASPRWIFIGSNNVPSESATSLSGLHSAHRRIAASSSSLVDVDAMSINSDITSNIYIFSSFNDVDPFHMMLVDCCVLCCRGCGPIAAVWWQRLPWSINRWLHFI